MDRWSAYPLYLLMEGGLSFLGTTIWVVGAVYYVLSVHMNPLQLVLVGTVLEVSYLIFQVPTGTFADTRSRRLSVLIGGFIISLCWVGEGLVPLFVAIAVAEAFRGLGSAFFDGALEAWLADEMGEERFGQAMVRGTQISQVGAILGMPLGVALASIHLFLPMAVGGAVMLLFYLFLSLTMPESGFTPVRHENVSRLTVMRATLGKGVGLVRANVLLLAILAVAPIFGAFSEGFDRLWEAHFLKDIPFPHAGQLTPVVWFGIINVAVSLAGIAATQVVHRRVDTSSRGELGRTLLWLNGGLIVGVVAFGIAGNFFAAVAAFGAARVIRRLQYPLYTAWLNTTITEPGVRATVLSLQGGADALGQSAGGPLIGLVGTLFSLRAAITAAGLLLLPALPLYGWSLRREQRTPSVVGQGFSPESRADSVSPE
jgi:DHA3 family tetracycline resistance protein-like MFS transporter